MSPINLPIWTICCRSKLYFQYLINNLIFIVNIYLLLLYLLISSSRISISLSSNRDLVRASYVPDTILGPQKFHQWATQRPLLSKSLKFCQEKQTKQYIEQTCKLYKEAHRQGVLREFVILNWFLLRKWDTFFSGFHIFFSLYPSLVAKWYLVCALGAASMFIFYNQDSILHSVISPLFYPYAVTFRCSMKS